jgi:hypothetical protein
MPRRKTRHTPPRTQVELLKATPSKLFAAARTRSGAGVHADQGGRYGKRQRRENRTEERDALLGSAGS